MWGRKHSVVSTLSIAALLVLVALAFVAFTGSASIESGSDDLDVYIYSESLDYQSIYVGDEDVQFYIRMRNGYDDSSDDDDPIRNCNLSIDNTVRDENGYQTTSPIANWDTREVEADATIYEGSYYSFSTFQFDVRANAKPMVYNLTVVMDFRLDTGTRSSHVGYIHFDISPRAEVSDVYGLYPGDKQRSIDINIDVYATLTDSRIYVTAPSGFSWFGTTGDTASAFREGSWYYDWYPTFSISVEQGLPPGPYQGSYRLEYENSDDVQCAEEGDIEFNVNPLPMLTAAFQAASVDQGTTEYTMNVTFSNSGNVDLYEVKVWIDDISDAFIFTAADHYEGSGTVSYSEVDIGDLRMGKSVSVDIDVILDAYIPEGKHKVLMDFSGFFFDPVQDSHGRVTTYWTSSSRGYYPVVRVDTSNIYLNPDYSSVKGTFAMLTVVDDTAEVRVDSSSVLELGGQLMDNWVTLYVDNFGNVDYDNVVLRVETNTEASPFLNPVDPDATASEDIRMSGTMRANRGYYVTAHLTIGPGTSPGVYNVPVMMTGINADTGSAFETGLEARITLRGVGPRLEISDVEPAEVRSGDDFTLKLKVTNVGDDTAWGVLMSVPPNVHPETGRAAGVVAAVNTPEPQALPLYLGDIAPGETVMVEVPMKCSRSSEPGQVYPFYFTINCTDSYGLHPTADALNYEVAIKTQESVWDLLIPIVVVIFIVALVAVAFVSMRRGGGDRPAKADKGTGSPSSYPQATVEQPKAKETKPTVTAYAPPPAEVGGTTPPKAATPPPVGTVTVPPATPEGVATGDSPGRPIYLNGYYEDSKCYLNWREPLGTEEGAVARYKIYRWAPGTEMKEVAELANVLDYEDVEIEPGTTYNYAVTSMSDTGQSELSKSIEVKTV